MAIVALAGLFFAGACQKRKPHSVVLAWHAPAPRPGVMVKGYSIYRSTNQGGPYLRIASGITTLSYTDDIVNNGTTYFYVVTAVDQNNRESKYSGETQAKIP